MKDRVTLTIDPVIARKAKRLARERGTSVSGLFERYLRLTPLHSQGDVLFVERWGGRFRLAAERPGDARMRALKTKYRLDRG